MRQTIIDINNWEIFILVLEMLLQLKVQKSLLLHFNIFVSTLHLDKLV